MTGVPIVRASLAMSLDGFIADPDGGVAWLDDFATPELDFAGFMERFGAIVVGRRTYDEARAKGYPIGGGQTVTVLTHRPLDDPDVRAYAGDLAALLEALRAELAGTGKDIWLMGGGDSLRAFREADLVDEREIAVIPILLGAGVPLFPPGAGRRASLRLVRHEVYASGIANLVYRRGD